MEKFIARYLHQEVIGYSADGGTTFLLCTVQFNDGSIETIIETRDSSPMSYTRVKDHLHFLRAAGYIEVPRYAERARRVVVPLVTR